MNKLTALTTFLILSVYSYSAVAEYNYKSYLGQPVTKLGESSKQDTGKSAVALKSVKYQNRLDLNSVYKKYIKVKPDAPHAKRGIKEATIYEAAAPAVVLIITNEGEGSGSVITDKGEIITNWHVVSDYETVAVVFKFDDEEDITENDIYTAKVVKYDEVKDLAVIRLIDPPKSLNTLSLGDKTQVKVGHDVHAIGHPTGESWTYTKGFISQFRKNYEWLTDMGVQHKANVIQTQTPINPGNSGGPLLNDAGQIIGINSFKAEGEAMNFAVDVDDIRMFIKSKRNVIAERKQIECDPEPISSERTEENDGEYVYFDMDCNGEMDSRAIVFDDETKPLVLSIDTTNDGKYDKAFFDKDRDGKWDVSYHDTDSDGKANLIGYHPDGEIEPSSYEKFPT